MKKICVVGLGYIGYPLAVSLAQHFSVSGYDSNKRKINEIKKFKKIKNFKFSNNINCLANSDVFIVTVPTPIYSNNKPDLSHIINATNLISQYINKKTLIIYESTVYPGVTEEVCVPILEKVSKLKLNRDFYVGYSPERVNVGQKSKDITKINKIISGSNNLAIRKVKNIYSKIIKADLHTAPSIKVAEAAKVIENIQRDINIALVNELSIIFDKLKIDSYSVFKAASTKWNYVDYRPGLVGGHCVGVDPYYLAHKSKLHNIKPKIILQGRKVNESMSNYASKKLQKQINLKFGNKSINLLVLGCSFKRDCDDVRNSKVFDLFNHLQKKYKSIYMYDPIAKLKDDQKQKYNFLKTIKGKYDVIILAVSHKIFLSKKFNLFKYLKKDYLLFDIMNSLKKDKLIIKL